MFAHADIISCDLESSPVIIALNYYSQCHLQLQWCIHSKKGLQHDKVLLEVLQ